MRGAPAQPAHIRRSQFQTSCHDTPTCPSPVSGRHTSPPSMHFRIRLLARPAAPPLYAAHGRTLDLRARVGLACAERDQPGAWPGPVRLCGARAARTRAGSARPACPLPSLAVAGRCLGATSLLQVASRSHAAAAVSRPRVSSHPPESSSEILLRARFAPSLTQSQSRARRRFNTSVLICQQDTGSAYLPGKGAP